jgi:hypothetical protein
VAVPLSQLLPMRSIQPTLVTRPSLKKCTNSNFGFRPGHYFGIFRGFTQYRQLLSVAVPLSQLLSHEKYTAVVDEMQKQQLQGGRTKRDVRQRVKGQA